MTIDKNSEKYKKMLEESKFVDTAIRLIINHTGAKPNEPGNKGARGIVICPKCNGELMYTVASINGHIWGKCKTKDCIQWMM